MLLCAQTINSYMDNGMPELREQVVNPDSRTILRAGEYVVDRQTQRVSLTPAGMMIVLRQLGNILACDLDKMPTVCSAEGTAKASMSSAYVCAALPQHLAQLT